MTAFAPSPQQVFAPSPQQVPLVTEMAGSQLSDEDREKLQEIHELINLMIREMPAVTQSAARPYAMPTFPAVPYAYSFFRFPWG
jgi:hypothetical protein